TWPQRRQTGLVPPPREYSESSQATSASRAIRLRQPGLRLRFLLPELRVMRCSPDFEINVMAAFDEFETPDMGFQQSANLRSGNRLQIARPAAEDGKQATLVSIEGEDDKEITASDWVLVSSRPGFF